METPTVPTMPPDLKRRRRRTLVVFLAFFGVILAGAIGSAVYDKITLGSWRTFAERSDRVRTDDDLQALQRTGLLQKIEADGGGGYSVFVDPWLWANTNVDQKRGVCMIVSRHRLARKGNGRVAICSYQTGERLATYSPAAGYRPE